MQCVFKSRSRGSRDQRGTRRSVFDPGESPPSLPLLALPLTSRPGPHSLCPGATSNPLPQTGPLPLTSPLHNKWGRHPKTQSDHPTSSLENPPRASACPQAPLQTFAIVSPLPSRIYLFSSSDTSHHIPLSSHSTWGTLPAHAVSLSICPCYSLDQLLLNPGDSAPRSPPPGSLP